MLSIQEVKTPLPVPRRRRSPRPCECPVYPFPHRRGGGRCTVGQVPVCALCGEPTELEFQPREVTRLEGNGMRHPVVVSEGGEASRCCGAPVIGEHETWDDYEWAR